MNTSTAPWHYDEKHINVVDGEGRTVAARPIYSSCAGSTEEADMRLIAATPDLLAALEAIAAIDHAGGSAQSMGYVARAAIAKAKGA